MRYPIPTSNTLNWYNAFKQESVRYVVQRTQSKSITFANSLTCAKGIEVGRHLPCGLSSCWDAIARPSWSVNHAIVKFMQEPTMAQNFENAHWKAECRESGTLRLAGGSWKSACNKVTRWLPTRRN